VRGSPDKSIVRHSVGRAGNQVRVNRDSVFDYGRPAGYGGNRTAADVVAQWIMEESSGNLTDYVSGIVLTANGTPTYGVVATGPHGRKGPGITFDGATDYFINAGAQASMDIGTTDNFVLEANIKVSSGAGAGALTIHDTWQTTDGISCWIDTGGTVVSLYLENDPTTVQVDWTIDDIRDDKEHKLHIACTRGGNAILRIDNVLIAGSSSIAALDGDAIPAEGASIGGSLWNPGTDLFEGTIYEVRVTVGNSTNDSGP